MEMPQGGGAARLHLQGKVSSLPFFQSLLLTFVLIFQARDPSRQVCCAN